MRPNLRSNICIHRRLERWTNMYIYIYIYICCSCKWIFTDECLVYIHSLDSLLYTHITKIVWFHISQIWSATGPISPFMVLPLSIFLTVHWTFESSRLLQFNTRTCMPTIRINNWLTLPIDVVRFWINSCGNVSPLCL